MKKGSKPLWENVVENFSIITVVYFFLSYMSLSYYYWLFDIDIVNYVDIKYLTFNWASNGLFWFTIIPLYLMRFGEDIFKMPKTTGNDRASIEARVVITIFIAIIIGSIYVTHQIKKKMI